MTAFSWLFERLAAEREDMADYANRLGTSPEGFVAGGYAGGYEYAIVLVQRAAPNWWKQRRRWKKAREVRRNR